MGKNRRRASEAPAELPEGCHHYEDLADVPWDIQKYYHQRYKIFSRYDEGILMTDEAWFGVTPEPVANKVAQHITEAAPAEKRIIIDAFAGAGGNAIAFASSGRWKRVYAIEKDPQVLACAKHNAEVYGVGDKISWYEGDCFSIIEKELADIGEYSVVFASPPWGGQAYRTDSVFNLSNMQPYSLSDILHPFQRLIGDVVLYLPRTSDLRQLATFAVNDQKVTVIHYCMEGASKALCAYFGGFQLR
ncbi:rna methylase family [Lasallia pustulata]|uniref:Trimethylguanosine synthase n=1 Tax=Lasallia pustulata TaxID=136370 RepID=A0A1W5CZ16_9LECA|nr:rna methylase family [Lasallia pustulata]